MRIADHFDRSARLKPDPERYWSHTETTRVIRSIFLMMKHLSALPAVLALATLGLAATATATATAQESTVDNRPVDFRRDVRPVLSRNCFACHGPDEESRAADLRLDESESACDTGAIVPGDPDASTIIERVTSHDDDERMPPPETNKELTPKEIEILRAWIASGAQYETHWAFRSVSNPEPPKVSDSKWATHPLDEFILAELDRNGLKPMPPADRTTLIRRATLDLTGLPPTVEEVDAFLADTSDDAYDRLLDRLFESPHYGEHMARFWLDAARYADTFGLHEDDYQSIWPYRDWVVSAFNQNMPFDQFTIEQLAGDLLPEPTTEQLVATGFNRVHVSTNEGGVIPDEFLVRYAVDRTSTTSTVWMGLTAACATCHDHKFDPLTMKEFYSFMAFFNNVDEGGVNGGYPIRPWLRLWKTQEDEAKAASLQTAVHNAKEALKKSPDDEALKTRVSELEKELAALHDATPVTMVMRERKERRGDYLLIRGQYDLKGDAVSMSVPAFLPPLKEPSSPGRLALAEWLCEPDHPLTSRVTVNRFWQQVFGGGLVETADDFGSQGTPPTHPELLDHLASTFMNDGWNVRSFMTMLLTSSTYQQNSRVSPEAERIDPQNRLLSRGARFRLSGEAIRDCVLATSDLLVGDLGGPPVKPYQPAGLWKAVAHASSKTAVYKRDDGGKLYRRSLYTFWKRGAPPPTMQIFDAPNRDSCVVRRDRTNTPLQALLTMNDIQFVEAARHMAARGLKRSDADAERIECLFRTAVTRRPTDRETASLKNSLHRFRQLYEAQPRLADELSNVGESKVQTNAKPTELAAWTMLCNQILNLDEFVTKD